MYGNPNLNRSEHRTVITNLLEVIETSLYKALEFILMEFMFADINM